MKTKTSTFSVACLFLFLFVPSVCLSQEETRGARRVGPQLSGGYRQTWALIIGVNYEGRQPDLPTKADRDLLPKLNNAVNDAESLRDVLQTYYSSAEREFGYYDDSHLRVLLEEDATEERIKDEVERLCDPELVKPEDSVLVYFAGHAVRLDDQSRQFGDAVALLPYDVKVSNGQVFGNTVGLPYELVSRLSKVPAKHKMLVLDCCYSGEIFEVPTVRERGIAFKGRGSLAQASARSDPSLQYEPAFQALASCRRTQLASDRDKQNPENSPFTTALVDGLKRLPARMPHDRRVWASRLLFHIVPQFEDRTQRPDCRNLVERDGEFCFHPAEEASFDAFMVSANEATLLQASVASRQGNWWFDEMPWFIPSVREELLKPLEHEKKRSSTVVDLIEPREILRLSREFVATQKPDRSLQEMRARHVKLLLQTRASQEFEQTLEAIRDEMLLHSDPQAASVDHTDEAPLPELLDLAAPDRHLLAVVHHALGDEVPAEVAYKDALRRYNQEIARDEQPLTRILQALCQADFGEYLIKYGNSPQDAAEQFRAASMTMRKLLGAHEELQPQSAGNDGTGIFEVYSLCRQADAWSSINHWSKADRCLADALIISSNLAPAHFLTAHVHRRRAWAEIKQWRLNEAERSFVQSSSILGELFIKDLELQNTVESDSQDIDRVGSRPRLEEIKEVPDIQGIVLPPAYFHSADFPSKIAYLHNLHGLAMTRRFRGDSAAAARDYREIVSMVESTYTDFRGRSADADVNDLLLGRIINTQERLADCNLFGHPKVRDLKEALDDYRRAKQRVHLLRDGRERHRWTAILLYKQALVLSLPSSIQDTALATEMCERADAIYSDQEKSATGLYRALGTLVTPVVSLLRQSAAPDSGEDKASAEADLRTVLLAFRDVVGQSPHRDELELCLFAAKILLEVADNSSRYQALEDADLLLSFCRIGLSPYQSDALRHAYGSLAEDADSRAYLRPYYDAVMRAKMKISRQSVRDLLEIQQEATQGECYVKSRDVMPILAMYVLDGECFLLFDLPRGESKCVSVSELYGLDQIRNASASSDALLPLPRGIHELLSSWWQDANLTDTAYDEWKRNYCWWQDPIHEFAERQLVVEPPQGTVADGVEVEPDPANAERITTLRPVVVTGQFPFELPQPSRRAVSPGRQGPPKQ